MAAGPDGARRQVTKAGYATEQEAVDARRAAKADPEAWLPRKITPLRRVDPGHLYFIQQGDDGPVKIGRSVDPAKRLSELQTSSPFPLRLLAVHEGRGGDEKRWHGLLWLHRLSGEWFHPSVEVLAAAAGGGLPSEEDEARAAADRRGALMDAASAGRLDRCAP